MKNEILNRLGEIGREENVWIFYACESGSRAWGFPSTDSDYDVRFLYLHPRDWYLSIDVEEKRDVIERPISDALDISGWDLRKALKLLRKSNPPLLEWLNSPIIYKEEPAQDQDAQSITNKLRYAVSEFYSPRSSYYHYLHMAEGNYREYLKGDVVWIKKYFYVLRPLLAIRWIETDPHPVPMEFDTLVDCCVDSLELKQAITDLLARKRAGQELDRQPRIEPISDFIESELERLKNKPEIAERTKPDFEKLNELFRNALDEAVQTK